MEHDPQASLPATSEATSQLAGSNTARLEILQELLAAELSLDTSSHPSIAYTPAYFLGRHEVILLNIMLVLSSSMTNECKDGKENLGWVTLYSNVSTERLPQRVNIR